MEVRFWETSTGRKPVEEFVSDQPPEAFARIARSIDHFEQQGLRLLANPKKLAPMPPHHGLYELKIDFRGVFYRIIFCVARGIAHFLVAFKKKGNRTPHDRVELAVHRQKMMSA